MRDLVIRPSTPQDLEEIAKIMAGAPAWAEFGINYERALKMLQETEDNIFTAELNNEVVGCITLRLNGVGNVGAYILIVAVKESYRSQNIGAELINFAAEKAKQHLPNLFLICSVFNTRAQKFYERNGFEKVGILKDLYVEGQDEIWYRKRLGTVSLKD